MTLWNVYVDFPRTLDMPEGRGIYNAMDDLVPEGGALGGVGGRDELFFMVRAADKGGAVIKAEQLATKILERAKVNVTYKVTVSHS